MSKQPHSANTVELKKAQAQVNVLQLTQNWASADDVFTRLCRRLLTTLDPNRMLDIFSEELVRVLDFDSMSYCRPTGRKDFTYSIGTGGQHHCDYQLTLQGEDLGEFRIYRRRRFRDEELVMIEQLMGLLVFPLRNAWQFKETQEAAVTDATTGLGNKRLMDQNLQRETDIALRHSEQCAVILCDLDHFKKVNDTYGHLAGDAVLRDTARLLQEAVRVSDSCYRYGGEEFAILLPRTTQSDARAVAERIRSAVAAHCVDAQGQQIKVTISLGIAMGGGKELPQELIRRADVALYAAKEAGRNCVRTTSDIAAAVLIAGTESASLAANSAV